MAPEDPSLAYLTKYPFRNCDEHATEEGRDGIEGDEGIEQAGRRCELLECDVPRSAR